MPQHQSGSEELRQQKNLLQVDLVAVAPEQNVHSGWEQVWERYVRQQL